ncbi:MAG: MBL fold metallo-hydrolase [Lentisphaerae bacterium]|jgi:hydroxyacylglutathione hydrolase|nr:MBL fold metallo-hydrolase [Lentisphaerota bacterium]
MLFQQFKVEGLGCLSYMIGCPAAGTACVVDPERHVDQYLQVAQKHGLRITHIFDTHLHADHLTGSGELAARTGADIYVHPGVEAAYPHKELHEGDRFRFGAGEIEIIETFGHTPNSVTLAVCDHSRSEDVFALLTGDLLFVGDVGRPDLAGADLLEEQVKNLYNSLHSKLARFPDWTEIYPAHGEGSLCGKGMSAKPMSTLGFERRNNPLLKMSFAEFHKAMTKEFQVRPDNFAVMVDKNRRGPAALAKAAPFVAMSIPQVEEAKKRGARIVDTRVPSAFGAAFIEGAVNIGLTPASVNWLGMVIPADTDIIIVADTPARAQEAAHIYRRAGYDRLIGYIGDGISGWAAKAKPLNHLPQISTAGLKRIMQKYPDHVIVDVRSDAEWSTGHIDRAKHIPIEQIIQKKVDLPKDAHITIVCASGYRANIAGSILKAMGYEDVFTLIGGMTAWKNANAQ